MFYKPLFIRKHKGDLKKRNKCKSGIKVALVFNESFTLIHVFRVSLGYQLNS